MKKLVPLFLMIFCPLALYAELADGIVPSGSTVLQLAKLPTEKNERPQSSLVRLAPRGRPMVLFNGRIVALAEESHEPFFDWTPRDEDGGRLMDFCFLNPDTAAILQETRLKIIQKGVCMVDYTLPARGGRLSYANDHHCYLFGAGMKDLLLIGTDGSVSNLLHTTGITAATGDGTCTFAAVGDTAYFLAPDSQPTPVLVTQNTIVDLALGPSNCVFYATEKGAGCMTRPGYAWNFLQQKIVSFDYREDRLLLLTAGREVVLIDAVSGFPSLIETAIQGSDER